MVSSAGQFLVRLRAMDHLCLPSKRHPQPKHQLSHQHHVIIFIVVAGRILPFGWFLFVYLSKSQDCLKIRFTTFPFWSHSHLFQWNTSFPPVSPGTAIEKPLKPQNCVQCGKIALEMETKDEKVQKRFWSLVLVASQGDLQEWGVSCRDIIGMTSKWILVMEDNLQWRTKYLL